jgi:hypothetical protein
MSHPASSRAVTSARPHGPGVEQGLHLLRIVVLYLRKYANAQ